MDLVDQYIKAVAKALPQQQREDITSELQEDIRSEMEDRQRTLGRELTQAEQESLLKQRGNPILLAARYRQDSRSVAFGRQFIGPVLYPFYTKVLSFNLGLTFLIVAIIFAALAVSGQALHFSQVFSTCLLQLFIQFGAVTLIFSLVQTHLTRHPDRWHLKGMNGGLALDLKIEENIRLRIERESTGWGPRVPRFESFSIVVASAVALAWVVAVQSHPFLILGPAAAFLSLAPVWHQLYLFLVLLTAAEIARALINLFRPDWTLFRAIARLVVHAGGLAFIYALIRGGAWVIAAQQVSHPASNLSETIRVINECFFFGFVVAAIFSLGMLIFRIVQLMQRWRGHGRTPRVDEKSQEPS